MGLCPTPAGALVASPQRWQTVNRSLTARFPKPKLPKAAVGGEVGTAGCADVADVETTGTAAQNATTVPTIHPSTAIRWCAPGSYRTTCLRTTPTLPCMSYRPKALAFFSPTGGFCCRCCCHTKRSASVGFHRPPKHHWPCCPHGRRIPTRLRWAGDRYGLFAGSAFE